ncbi:hypothetical protein D3C73_1561330 [compost metagenome]
MDQIIIMHGGADFMAGIRFAFAAEQNGKVLLLRQQIESGFKVIMFRSHGQPTLLLA